MLGAHRGHQGALPGRLLAVAPGLLEPLTLAQSMPLFMDIHKDMPGLNADTLAEAHRKDLELQGEHDVHFLKYWFDPEKKTAFCLSEAPDAKAALAVHEKAGHPANEIYQVDEGQ